MSMRVNKLEPAIKWVSIHAATIVFFMMLLIFISTSIFFATRLMPAIVPDEPAHFTLSKHFSTTLGIPPDVPETYALGYIGHKPFLYYWLNGRFLDVLEF